MLSTGKDSTEHFQGSLQNARHPAFSVTATTSCIQRRASIEYPYVSFFLSWRHQDGSVVNLSPKGWHSSDPQKYLLLNTINALTCIVPAIAPCVRNWLEDEFHLIEARRS